MLTLKNRFAAGAGVSLLLLWLASACSINLTDTAPPPTAPAQPTPTAQLNGAPAPTAIPPQWANLNLTGRLIFNQPKFGLTQLDLTTGALTTLFALPEEGWLTGAALSPDGQQFVLAYAPPPPSGEVQLGYTDLYLLPVGGDAPEILLARSDPQESFFNPLWSPDGQYVYFSHFKPQREINGTPPPAPFVYTIERLAYPGGSPEVVVTDAFWPALSSDGTRLTYVGSDPETYLNHLYVAEADGSNPVNLLTPDSFQAVDAPFFTPDGEAIVFSAVGEGPKALTWMDQLLGASSVFAAPAEHNVPSDWWRIPAAGGSPTRLTRIYDTGLFGDFAPDGEHIAFITGTGVYVMSPEGGNVYPLLGLQAFGSVEWVP
jgi:Tol biopolymer transport system component